MYKGEIITKVQGENKSSFLPRG